MRSTEASGVGGLGLVTYLSAVNAALTLRVHQDRVNGTAGQSVLLPVSYTNSDPRGYLLITWTRAGNVTAEYTCFPGHECSFNDSGPHSTVSDPYKYRAVLFPENASLLLKDLHINDSGMYELSIGHSAGTVKGHVRLTVLPDTAGRIDAETRNDTWKRKDSGHTTGTDSSPGERNKIIIPLVVLAVTLIILCFVVKMGRVCRKDQEERGEGNTRQDCQEPQEGAGVHYTEISWTQQAKAKTKMHRAKETESYASVQENSSMNCPAVLYTEVKPLGVTRTDGRKMQIPREKTEYAQIQDFQN